ncbi:hypothetical protein MNBD_GAMMA12-2343 [hydrothermal vent metagenome]|uniref:Uncharacterized protein n=1 Tax=hydrothermal vent metagenome TaxID=652676 RepID=A0A3B0YS34_9ZZZZ
MKWNKFSILWVTSFTAAVLLSGCGGGAKPAKNGFQAQKVVYHLNDLDKAYGALRNVKNHLNALGDKNANIVVVTHSSGAFTLVDGAQDKRGRSFDAAIRKLAKRGVRFEICANTMRGKKIKKNKIHPNALITPSGVARVADLQQQNYVYVKP